MSIVAGTYPVKLDGNLQRRISFDLWIGTQLAPFPPPRFYITRGTS
jgi:hypothetical protein